MIYRLLLLCALACAVVGCGLPGQSGTAANVIPHAGDAAPDFTYTLANGDQATLQQLRGKKVLINFWATWCGPCQEEMPALEKAHQQFGNDVVILGVNKEGVGKQPTIDAVNEFTQTVKVSFPLVMDFDGTIATDYGVHNLPMSYFINSDGTVSQVKLGAMDEAYITQQVGNLH